ncbi:hypothetical protein EYW49_20555 [Siculibacillus lacustris]|uniref:Uncharacterized protein n=1 Tax=Siculibacillus lacustris TaxID=1549641 RepID=A0A4Q9VF83_9HYPH|nr:hypothetical protein [Siculibacillus lacustris]TBW33353.1 hypothetical protein EYW49_20555 [Siculibacillus lacustris]
MSGERVLQATAIIDIEDRAGGKIEKLAKKLQSLDRLTKMMGKAEGFAAFDRQAQGIERAATAIGHLERQVANLTRLNTVAGDIDKMARAVERLDRAQDRGAASAHRLHENLRFSERLGQLGMVAGPAILAGTHHAWNAAAELKHNEVQMRQAGMSAPEIVRARTLAGSLAEKLPTLTVGELMELHRETRSSVRHPEEAFELLPELAKAKAAMRAMGINDTGLAEIVKAGESLGMMSDPARFTRFLEGQVKAMAWFGKTIDTTQIYEAWKYSKSAGATLSDEFINSAMPSIIQEMHGSSAGDALSMLVKTLRGGMQNKHIPVERMAELGLLADPDQIVRSKTGSIKGYRGKVVGDDLLAANPFQWFDTVFRSAAAKKGITALPDLVRLLNQTLPSTAANLGRIFLQQAETIRAHAQGINAIPSLDAMNENAIDDPKATLKELGHAIENFAGVLGSPIMSTAAHMMDGLAKTVGGWQERLSKFQEENPEAAKWLAGGALATGATVGAAGTYGLVSGLMNGFGLKGSALALDASAAALDAAAVKLAGGNLLGGLPGAPGGKKAGLAQKLGKLGSFGLMLWGALELGDEIPHPESLDQTPGEALDKLKALLSKLPAVPVAPSYLANMEGTPLPSSSLGVANMGLPPYVTGGDFGGDAPEVAKFSGFMAFVSGRGGIRSNGGLSAHDLGLSPLIQPPPFYPMPERRPDRPWDGGVPLPKPSEAEMAGFTEGLKSFSSDLESALRSGLTGGATITLEVKPGPGFEAQITGIVKNAMGNISLTGAGSTGRSDTNVDHHQ